MSLSKVKYYSHTRIGVHMLSRLRMSKPCLI